MINLPLPFNYHKNSSFVPDKWEELKNYLKDTCSFCDIEHQIEAKTVSVMSLTRRSICSAWMIGEVIGWKKTFNESLTLLFPMLELIGCARLGSSNYDECLYAGAEWLLNSDLCPSGKGKEEFKNDHRVINSLAAYMKIHKNGPEMKDIFYLRNYYLHGIKNTKDSNIQIEDLINFELPKAISLEAVKCLKHYWNQLKNDDGKCGWIDRLARAEIQPFIIQGSGIFDLGLVDPDIMDWLENPGLTCIDLYKKVILNNETE